MVTASVPFWTTFILTMKPLAVSGGGFWTLERSDCTVSTAGGSVGVLAGLGLRSVEMGWALDRAGRTAGAGIVTAAGLGGVCCRDGAEERLRNVAVASSMINKNRGRTNFCQAKRLRTGSLPTSPDLAVLGTPAGRYCFSQIRMMSSELRPRYVA